MFNQSDNVSGHGPIGVEADFARFRGGTESTEIRHNYAGLCRELPSVPVTVKPSSGKWTPAVPEPIERTRPSASGQSAPRKAGWLRLKFGVPVGILIAALAGGALYWAFHRSPKLTDKDKVENQCVCAWLG